VSAGGRFFEGEGITLRFGGVTALHDVGFSVAEGTVHAMIGPNGAGKTSLFNVVTGLYRPDSGTVRLGGVALSGMPPHAVAKAGIVRTFQNLEIFTNMSVLENVLTGAHLSAKYGPIDFFFRSPRFFREERRLRDDAMAELAFVGLEGEAALPAGQLPFGSQRLLEIARALAARPRILLLDEPAAGLNIRETSALGELIRRIVARGVTVVMVEHDMALVMDISDRVTVLNYGEVLADGTPAEVQRNPAVVAAYLGEEA
jgi:branched-chain amino acid transport system ATP-binding protein